MIVKGIEPKEDSQSIKLGKHDFYLRPIGNQNLLEKGETSYFRHKHIGQDNRVFYSINVKGKNSYDAKITRIQYNGPFNSGGSKNFDLLVNGALKESGPKGEIASKVLNFIEDLNLQSKIDGDWEVEATKIVDAIGKRKAMDAT